MKQLSTKYTFPGLFILCLTMVLLFDSCLIAVQFTGPPTANAGEMISTQLRIKTDAVVSPGQPIAAHVFLSVDPYLDPEDRRLTTAISYSGLEISSFMDFYHSFTIPANVTSGRYYLLAVISVNPTNDPAAVSRYDNGQNIYQHSIRITCTSNGQADLLLSNAHVGNFGSNYYTIPSYNLTQQAHFTLSVENRGELTSPISRINYYLSHDNHFSLAEDVLVGGTNIAAIAPQSRVEVTGNIPLADANVTDYTYIFYVLDANHVVEESNESNNIIHRQISVQELRPDLSITNLNIPGLAQAGTPVNLSGYLHGVPSGLNSTVGVYLSTDFDFNNTDEFLGSFTAPSGTFSQNILLPANISTGAYYLIVNANEQHTIPEYNYSNNYSTMRLFIIGTNFDDDPCEEVFMGLQSETPSTVVSDKAERAAQLEQIHPFELSIFPNPTSERITASMTLKKTVKTINVQLVDASGKVLHQMRTDNPEAGHFQQSMNVSLLPSGSYFLRVTDGKSIQTKPFVVK